MPLPFPRVKRLLVVRLAALLQRAKPRGGAIEYLRGRGTEVEPIEKTAMEG
jgi:hypothetical protein